VLAKASIANSFRVRQVINRLNPRVGNPGLKFVNAFGVERPSFHTVSQVCVTLLMNDRLDRQAENVRKIIDAFDEQFARVHWRARALAESTSIEILYRQPAQPTATSPVSSSGENLLRSAGAVEQTFGGITANLWDDPFEWTLPENLSTRERVIEYLEEVEATRKRAFDRFSDDSDLLKHVVVPSGETRPLISLLLETLVRAVEFQGRAGAPLGLVSDVRVSGFSC